MKMKIDAITLTQFYEFSVLYTNRNGKCKQYLANTPARFARFMSIVIAFAARHDEERKNAEN